MKISGIMVVRFFTGPKIAILGEKGGGLLLAKLTYM